METVDRTTKIRRVWDAYAPRYDRAIGFTERVWIGRDRREWVCSRAAGEVLEVAVGTGLNLALYPPGVTLIAVDLSPGMLAIARARAAELGRDVDLREADAEALPFGDASFDTVVCTLSLCAVPDNRAVIGEMYRVLRPGGRMLLLDHVVSTWWPVRVVQRAVERFTSRALGEYWTRRQLPLAVAAGFNVEETGRRKAGTVEWFAARKPGAPEEAPPAGMSAE